MGVLHRLEAVHLRLRNYRRGVLGKNIQAGEGAQTEGKKIKTQKPNTMKTVKLIVAVLGIAFIAGCVKEEPVKPKKSDARWGSVPRDTTNQGG